MRKRIVIGLVATVIGLTGVAVGTSPAQALPRGDGCRVYTWFYGGGYWTGYTAGDPPIVMYDSPYDFSDYGITNANGTVTTFC